MEKGKTSCNTSNHHARYIQIGNKSQIWKQSRNKNKEEIEKPISAQSSACWASLVFQHSVTCIICLQSFNCCSFSAQRGSEIRYMEEKFRIGKIQIITIIIKMNKEEKEERKRLPSNSFYHLHHEQKKLSSLSGAGLEREQQAKEKESKKQSTHKRPPPLDRPKRYSFRKFSRDIISHCCACFAFVCSRMEHEASKSWSVCISASTSKSIASPLPIRSSTTLYFSSRILFYTSLGFVFLEGNKKEKKKEKKREREERKEDAMEFCSERTS